MAKRVKKAETPHHGVLSAPSTPPPVKGYVPLTDRAVATVNGHKLTEERLLRVIDKLYLDESYYDRRWLAVAKTHFEEGFMALNRAVFRPQRIMLPEDAKAEDAKK